MRTLLLLAAGLLLVSCAPEAEEGAGAPSASVQTAAAADPTHAVRVTTAPPVPDVPEDPPTPEEQALSQALQDVAAAPDYAEPYLLIDDAWAPPPPLGVGQAAIYLSITNTGGADKFKAAETPVAGRAVLHGHVMDGDVARMEQRSELIVPPRGVLTLEPGGDHIMLMELTGPLTEGESFPLTLTFERAGSVDISVKVESLANHLAADAEAEEHSEH